MVKRDALLDALNTLLSPHKFRDYCPNGLQVEGREQVRRVITGVTASQALLDAAVAERADVVLVHHGHFWKNEDPCVRGIKRQRLQTLIGHDLNLIAYHLPLDAHPELGNNAQLGQRLGLTITGWMGEGADALGLVGRLPEPMPAEEFAAHVAQVLGRVPLHIGDDQDEIETIAWCTGAAQGFIEQAQRAGVDAYLSGEISEPTVHFARETGLHYFAAGHHATERYGVQALGDWLARRFDIEHLFIDIDNPV
ncbi:Nif3-like dinuclear metal center hexameric protein [Isoalcanivorax beigongshangi]|uniref:Nif3-like dinuclear metal center hexameric protein n=1 Tax=Isoalcanivorax beigongshangi TaxID=3238810 RepID=A0ABV4AJ26_9GAMM